jgi:hypothetical protein
MASLGDSDRGEMIMDGMEPDGRGPAAGGGAVVCVGGGGFSANARFLFSGVYVQCLLLLTWEAHMTGD